MVWALTFRPILNIYSLYITTPNTLYTLYFSYTLHPKPQTPRNPKP